MKTLELECKHLKKICFIKWHYKRTQNSCITATTKRILVPGLLLPAPGPPAAKQATATVPRAVDMGNLCSCFGAETYEERRQALLMAEHAADRVQGNPRLPIKAAELSTICAGGFMSPVPELPRGLKGAFDSAFHAQENNSPNQHQRTPDGYYAQAPGHSIISPPSFRSPLRMQSPDNSCGMGYSAEFGAIG